MRIISGKWKGKRLTAPKNLPTRPTTDFAKEGLFNVLSHRFYIEDLTSLDLFGGIGSISLELASRGANSITTVDKNRTCCKYIEQTSKELDLNQIHVIMSDVFSFLERDTATYNLIFADPPFDFDKEKYLQLLSLVFSTQRLKDDESLFILEHSKTMDFSEHPHFIESKKYSNIRFSFFS